MLTILAAKQIYSTARVMRIHYLQHVSYEGPGYIKAWAKKEGHKFSGTHLFQGEQLPGLKEFDVLVVLGGPMGVSEEHRYSWLTQEKKLVKSCIEEGKKVIGICLGAQLIAQVLGAEVEAMEDQEIGWFPIEWSEEARRHSLFSSFLSKQRVLHWHGDQFELPVGAMGLASSEGCKNQGFIIADKVLAFQFHMEMTKEGLSALINNSSDQDNSGPFTQDTAKMLDDGSFAENHQVMHKLFNGFLNNE